jgi:hypothetical protein
LTTPTRLVLSLACALAGARGVTHAQTVPQSPAALTAEIAAFLAAQPTWSASFTADASYGYKDNLLLSSAEEERSALARGSFELLLLHVPRGQVDFSLYAQAEGTHYFSGVSVHNESNAWLATDLGYRWGEAVKVSLPVTGFYSDRVLDASETTLDRVAAELKEIGAMVGPTLRWNFRPGWAVEGQAVGQRRSYEDHSYDSQVGEGSLRLLWSRGERLELRVGATERWRNFKDRAQYAASGRELPGTQLKIAEREGEARGDFKWGEGARWRTISRATISSYQDNGPGYFSFHARMFGQELEWKGERWSWRLAGSARRVNYDVQTVGLGQFPPERLKDEFSTELTAERKLTSRWRIFAKYGWDRTRSNDAIASYVVNEGLLGVRWSWEK